ncbi:MAG: M18 family aminopeptidase [Planctomycetota bacterium]|nr:M18 family aminopeptidase [Planctomycetota bacterium]
MTDAVQDLLRYIDASPTPYHAVAETARRLEEAGWTRLDEGRTWDPVPGLKGYVVRAEGSIIAFHLGSDSPAETGMRLIGAHTDSPNLRLKPQPERTAHGTRQLTVETYGGLLHYTWFDRDCSLAGRVQLRDANDDVRTVLVDLERPLLRVSSLAIHLNREVYESGFKPNAQQHMHPLLSLEGGPSYADLLDEALADHGATHDDVLAHDLMLYDVQNAELSGADEAFVHAARLDNLASCHAALTALLRLAETDAVPTCGRLIALWDHEEVGSRSVAGARGAFLRDVLSRLTGGGEPLRRAVAGSLLVSADMAHGVHPNYAERHDPDHMPTLGGGPVVKWNVNQSYTSDAVTAGHFVACAKRAGVTPQHYSHRNDLRCGSTIGPIAAAEVGIRTVDVGNPMLSMHSCREMSAAADHEPMIRCMAAHLESA